MVRKGKHIQPYRGAVRLVASIDLGWVDQVDIDSLADRFPKADLGIRGWTYLFWMGLFADRLSAGEEIVAPLVADEENITISRTGNRMTIRFSMGRENAKNAVAYINCNRAIIDEVAALFVAGTTGDELKQQATEVIARRRDEQEGRNGNER